MYVEHEFLTLEILYVYKYYVQVLLCNCKIAHTDIVTDFCNSIYCAALL